MKNDLVKKVKPSFDTNRQVLGKIYPLDTPFTVIIDTSERCNFKCSYCFRSDEDKQNYYYAAKNGLMQEDIFKLAIEQIKEFPHSVRQISFSHHGEPLCNPKVPEYVKYIKEQGFDGRVSIHTNGSLLDEKYALRLADSGIDRVIFSIQGMSEEKYKKTCGVKVDFKRLCNGIKTLYENKKNTEVNVKIIDVALENGEDKSFYDTFLPIADRAFIEKVVPIWEDKNYNNLTDIQLSDDANKYGNTIEKVNCCRICFDTIVVTPDGDVYPCTQLAMGKCLGNIKSKSLLELWNSKERFELMKQQLTLQKPCVCEKCYIPKNSVYVNEDWIDPYRKEILERLELKKDDYKFNTIS